MRPTHFQNQCSCQLWLYNMLTIHFPFNMEQWNIGRKKWWFSRIELFLEFSKVVTVGSSSGRPSLVSRGLACQCCVCISDTSATFDLSVYAVYHTVMPCYAWVLCTEHRYKEVTSLTWEITRAVPCCTTWGQSSRPRKAAEPRVLRTTSNHYFEWLDKDVWRCAGSASPPMEYLGETVPLRNSSFLFRSNSWECGIFGEVKSILGPKPGRC